MSRKNEMHNVLELQKMRNLISHDLTSNLSFVCKERSTLSLFLCVPNGEN